MTSNSNGIMIADRTAEYNDNLALYLKQIGGIFDIQSIINEPQDKPQIISYYLKNKLTYRLGHNWQGFLHCGISYDGKHKKEDFKEQARIVERYVRDNNAKKVLELGYGLGANCAFLANRNPLVMFEGVDISNKPLKRFTKMPNAHFKFDDYHDLGTVEDNAYDIVFTIEALCHSTNKLQVLRVVKKKLKKDGLFIVIDGYRRDYAATLSPSEEVMVRLIEKGFSVDAFECVKDVERYMRKEYLTVVTKDISQCVLPCMAKGQWALHYFSHPALARVVNRFLPLDVVKNTIVALLLPISIRRDIACYYIHVLKKDS